MTVGNPIRSSREIYKIQLIKREVDDEVGIIDRLPGSVATQTQRIIYVKMKIAIAEWLGLFPLPYDSPDFEGTFQGNGLNKGIKYRRKIGGFKVASYTLIAKDLFTVNEQVVNTTTGVISRPVKYLKTMTIGFPTGHSVTEVIAFLANTGKLSEIAAIRAPSGSKTSLGIQTVNAPTP